LNDFIIENEFGKSKCVGISTDRAPAISVKYNGFIAHIQAIMPGCWARVMGYKSFLFKKQKIVFGRF
jgi:hypothetical protein